MDTRVVAVFVFLFLSTGYSLMQCNVDADDDILDMLQETDNLKEAPAVVSCQSCSSWFAVNQA